MPLMTPGKENANSNKRTNEENEVLNSNSVSVYPNPFGDFFNLKFTLAKPVELTIAIYNSMGGVAYSKTGKKYGAGEHAESIRISGTPGIYTLHISGAGVNYLTQIIKI